MEHYIFWHRPSRTAWIHVRYIGIYCVLFLLSTKMPVNADKGETMARIKYSVAVKTVDDFQVYYVQQNEKSGR